jgi:ABC-type enterochelin transport system permease subunit
MNTNLLKALIVATAAISLLFLPSELIAQQYTPLEPSIIQVGGNTETNVDFFQYLSLLYITALIVAATLAVLMIVVGGIEYIVSSVPGAKGDAKNRITNAVFGLLLVLSTWLILNTINPQILKLDRLDMNSPDPALPPPVQLEPGAPPLMP